MIDGCKDVIIRQDHCVLIYDIDPETVGQYTGLYDKNDKKIFEGDILKIEKVMNGLGDYYIHPIVAPCDVVVKWDFCAWMWETISKNPQYDKRYIGFPEAWCQFKCEVIGNIYDNPELVVEKNEKH